jgi:Glycosyltransferase family 9 (heptosyltransferase)
VGFQRGALTELLRVDNPAVCFVTNIGDSVLTLPALRALGEMFAGPMTLICPKVAFELCFHQVSTRCVDITGLPLVGAPPLPGQPERHPDYDALVAEIGSIDVFIDTLPWNSLSDIVIRPLVQRLAPTTSIGFSPDLGYDVVVPKAECHAADLMFALAHLFDPELRIENFAQPVPIPPNVRRDAQSMRAAVPAGVKVLVVHADTNWSEKRWPVTRFIDLLDRFLSRHRDFVAWVVGMGYEELNAGRERDRIFAQLGLPLDLTMGLVACADVFVGIDSSMLHAADLARVPGVGLFGATRAAEWGFRFAPHRHVERPAMTDITVAAVLDAMEDLVGEHVAPSRRSAGGWSA